MTSTRIAIAGLGTIGKEVARRVIAGDLPGFTLGAVATGSPDKARTWLEGAGIDCPVVSLDDLPQHCDMVIESAPAEVLEAICMPMLRASKKVVVLSCGALLPRWHIVEAAKAHGGQIIVPTGGLLGLDAVTAAAEGTIQSVKMITRKPPRGLVGAPYLVAKGLDMALVNAPMKVFSGSAREAAAGFPANVNVAAALSLAGIGPDLTTIDIWADPEATRNNHRIEVVADSASFTLEIANVPSENPKTGKIVALSVIALLRKMNAPLRVGT
ncbi:MAG: aspartate dehydrogenase [Alphaproteobacteria bacterium]